MDYIFKFGRVVRNDINDSLDDLAVTKKKIKRDTRLRGRRLTEVPASGAGDLQRHPKLRKFLSILHQVLG